MMGFEWMSHGEMDLPLRMVALWCPRVSRGWERDGRWADVAIGGGGAGPRGKEAEGPLPSPLGSFLWPPLWPLPGSRGVVPHVPGSWGSWGRGPLSPAVTPS